MKQCSLPLAGVKVFDLTNSAAGPGATRCLADWGADVWKVEPIGGEVSRRSRGTSGLPEDEDGISPGFEQFSGNKLDLCIDYKTPEGRAVLKKLLAKADIFISNYREGALKGMGFDFETLHKEFPSLVWAGISGYGDEGPMASAPGYDTLCYFARTGIAADLPEENTPPIPPALALGDATLGLALAGALCAALYQKSVTGKGDRVSLSLFGLGTWAASSSITQASVFGNGRRSRTTTRMPLNNTYRTKDGEWVQLSILDYRMFDRLCKALGRTDLTEDPRLGSLESIRENNLETIKILDAEFGKHDCAEIEAKMSAEDVPFVRLSHFEDVITDEQAIANDYVHPSSVKGCENVAICTTPVRFGGGATMPCRYGVPRLGENTVDILREAGLEQSEIDSLLKSGVAVQWEKKA